MTPLPSNVLLQTSSSTPVGLRYWWKGTLTLTWSHQRGLAKESKPRQPLQTPECRAYIFTPSCTTNHGRRAGGRGACVTKIGRCGPRRTTFWEWTAVCYKMSSSRTSGTTKTISWSFGASVAFSNRTFTDI